MPFILKPLLNLGNSLNIIRAYGTVSGRQSKRPVQRYPVPGYHNARLFHICWDSALQTDGQCANDARMRGCGNCVPDTPRNHQQQKLRMRQVFGGRRGRAWTVGVDKAVCVAARNASSEMGGTDEERLLRREANGEAVVE